MISNSKIRWTYLLEFTYNTTDSGYLFLEEYRAKPANYVCVSNFKKMLTMDQDKSSTHYSKQKQ